MINKRTKCLIALTIIIIFLFTSYIIEYKKWSQILGENDVFYSYESALIKLRQKEDDELKNIGFSIEQIDEINNLSVESIKNIDKYNQVDKILILSGLSDLDKKYQTIYMTNKEQMDDKNFLENKYVKVEDKNAACVIAETLKEYYYIYNIKIKTKKLYFLKQKNLELFNNVSNSPYFSLIILTYTDKYGNKIAEFESFSDFKNDIIDSFSINTINMKTRINDYEKFVLSGIEIIDVRKKDEKQFAEYSINKNSVSPDYIHGLFIFPE
ncbi:MAG: hypothetical protein MJA31_16585 [Clostridia bacterium]|nr:hypothetical protein [Clostridia bacterium]